MSAGRTEAVRFPSLSPEESERLESQTRAMQTLGSQVAHVQADVATMKREFPDMKRSIDALNGTVDRAVSAVVSLSKQINGFVASQSLPPARSEARSFHGFDNLLADAGDTLRRRIKDPKDPLNEDRAYEIAAEVHARLIEAKDAHSLRAIKKSGKALAFEIAKYVAVGSVGALGYYLKSHLGL